MGKPKDPFKALKSGFGKVGKDMNKSFAKAGKELKGGFGKIGQEFKKIGDAFKCMGNIFKSIGSYLKCGFTRIVNLPTCIIYYLLDCVYYCCIGLPVWFCCWVFPPLGTFVSLAGQLLATLDSFVHGFTGFHIFRYQDSVIKRCYECSGFVPFPNFSSISSCANGLPKKDPNKSIKYTDCKLNRKKKKGIQGVGVGPHKYDESKTTETKDPKK